MLTPLLWSISGGRYAGLPQKDFANSFSPTFSFASPKSASLQWPSLSIKIFSCKDYYRNPEESSDDENEDYIDRKVLYECENNEIAKYIVAKIKTSIILNQDKNNLFLKNLKEWLIEIF